MITIPNIVADKMPRHVAIIMDGNGRWASRQGKDRAFGHAEGVNALRRTITKAVELGIEYMTVYAFSTENWDRPQSEVDALMSLLVQAIESETEEMQRQGIRLLCIGDTSRLPSSTLEALRTSMKVTADNRQMTLVLALSYSSQEEMAYAVRRMIQEALDGKLNIQDITPETIADHLYTAQIPDPDFLIRTGGEKRISNFLLWQLSYAELYFTDAFWPDFDGEHLIEAIRDYQRRDRRFGRIDHPYEISDREEFPDDEPESINLR